MIVSRKAIQRRVAELGRLIRSHYGEEAVVLLVVLKGASAFAHDLGREIGRCCPARSLSEHQVTSQVQRHSPCR